MNNKSHLEKGAEKIINDIRIMLKKYYTELVPKEEIEQHNDPYIIFSNSQCFYVYIDIRAANIVTVEENEYLHENELNEFLAYSIYKKNLRTHSKTFIISYEQEKYAIVMIHIEKIKDKKIIINKDLNYKQKKFNNNYENKIIKYIADTGKEGVSLSGLTFKFRNITKVLRKNIIKNLLFNGKISETIDRSNGRMKKVYTFNKGSDE